MDVYGLCETHRPIMLFVLFQKKSTTNIGFSNRLLPSLPVRRVSLILYVQYLGTTGPHFDVNFNVFLHPTVLHSDLFLNLRCKVSWSVDPICES